MDSETKKNCIVKVKYGWLITSFARELIHLGAMDGDENEFDFMSLLADGVDPEQSSAVAVVPGEGIDFMSLLAESVDPEQSSAVAVVPGDGIGFMSLLAESVDSEQSSAVAVVPGEGIVVNPSQPAVVEQTSTPGVAQDIFSKHGWQSWFRASWQWVSTGPTHVSYAACQVFETNAFFSAKRQGSFAQFALCER